jgi:hypothetical protein
MSSGISCCNECATTLTVNTPGAPGPAGPAGADGADALISPAAGNPEGNVVALPGQTYLNTTDDSFWIKKSGLDEYGWICLIGAAACLMFMLFLSGFSANAAPILQTYFTTNTTPVVSTYMTNAALSSQTNNYAYLSNNIVLLSTTNSTITSFNTNIVRWMNTNDAAFTNYSLVRTRWAVTNDSGTTNQMLLQQRWAYTNDSAITNHRLYSMRWALTNDAASTGQITNLSRNGVTSSMLVINDASKTNQLTFTGGILTGVVTNY